MSRDALFVRTLEALLRVDATDVRSALGAATDVLAAALGADKVDVFALDVPSSTLVALGTSATPMGARQHALGLDRLPLANGGRTAEVHLRGQPFMTGDLARDDRAVPGIVDALGVRSMLIAPVDVPDGPRAVLAVASATPGKWSDEDLTLVRAAASWIGHLMHRARLVEALAARSRDEGRRAAAEDLVTILAHEMRNYLSPLRGRLDLLHRRAAREGRDADRRDAELAARALVRLARIVDDLMDVGRIDAGLFHVEREPTDLAAVAQAIADEMGQDGHAVVVRAPGDLVANVDARLRHALENLVANAVKHSPAGGAVEIEVRPLAREDGPWAELAVTNAGEPVPEVVLPHLFDRFARGPGSTGLGLGLYLAREIARAHGGDVVAETSPSRTTFRLRVPAR